jgi:hypothetical protein
MAVIFHNSCDNADTLSIFRIPHLSHFLRLPSEFLASDSGCVRGSRRTKKPPPGCARSGRGLKVFSSDCSLMFYSETRAPQTEREPSPAPPPNPSCANPPLRDDRTRHPGGEAGPVPDSGGSDGRVPRVGRKLVSCAVMATPLNAVAEKNRGGVKVQFNQLRTGMERQRRPAGKDP